MTYDLATSEKDIKENANKVQDKGQFARNMFPGSNMDFCMADQKESICIIRSWAYWQETSDSMRMYRKFIIEDCWDKKKFK
jgi:hypothetical protein